MTQLSTRIRRHYDLLAPVYYFLWGQHVHHGYWDDAHDATPAKLAQERLLGELYDFAGQPKVERMLDVGCGYGGTLRWLANQTGAQGEGITLSPMQRRIASLKNRLAGQADTLTVQVSDAQKAWPFASKSFDLVWCMECSEHLENRAHFFSESYRVLKPSGTLCLAAWLASSDTSASAEALRDEVEKGMLCYPFDTAATYEENARAADFEQINGKIITEHVTRTWDLSIERRDHPLAIWLRQFLEADVSAFASSFDALRQAYLEGAMDYGFLVARKP